MSLVQRQPQDLWLLKAKTMTHFYLHHIWNACEFISHSEFHYCIPVGNFKSPRTVGTVGTKLLFFYREHFQPTTANISPIIHMHIPYSTWSFRFFFSSMSLFTWSVKDIHKSFFLALFLLGFKNQQTHSIRLDANTNSFSTQSRQFTKQRLNFTAQKSFWAWWHNWQCIFNIQFLNTA